MLYKKGFNLYLLFFIIVGGLFFYPILISFILMFMSLFLTTKESYRFNFLFISLFFSFLSLSINASGDMVSYYMSFNSYVFIDFITSLKYFRGLFFEIIHYLDMDVKIYSFISLFLISFFLLKLIYLFYESLQVNFNIRNKILFLCLFFSTFQLTYFFSYENFLGFVLFSYGQGILFLKEDKIKGWVFILISPFIHISLIIFVIYHIIFSILYERNVSFFKLIFISFFIPILLSFYYVLPDFNNLFLITIRIKLESYLNGGWSKYLGLHDYLSLLYNCVKLTLTAIFFRYILRKNNGNIYIKWIVFIFPLLVLFLSNRTLAIRFVFSGFLPCVYVFVYILNKCSIKFFQYLAIFSILLNSFSIFNYIGFSDLIKNINTDIYSLNIIKIFNDPVILDVRERVRNN
ncbi:hypothetical protein [Photobacterium phosphoreum]|uniref:hypothetical protein n=1 Tax=Photobacterium phosphoreum TaxID=659 RepID=UPI001E5885C3|nr:hypothetical protein [Photobacterium phosphoreum]MCD9508915.1 hypothetical protein [Photobacterium phosphoreum]